jgi:hypothetical protein
MYLRHVGREGCVDVDLATYYLGPQMAGWTVLIQVEAQSRQFAVWHQDQIVKLLPVPRLGRPGDGPGRLAAVHQARGVGCSSPFFCSFIQESPTAVSVGRRSLISSFIRRLSHMLASPSGKCGNPLSPCRVKTSDNQKQSLIGAAIRSTFHSSSSHTPAFPYSPSAVSMSLLHLR